MNTPLDQKLVETLRARAALAGFELVALSDGSFFISRWSLHRELQHASAVERFLDRACPLRARATDATVAP